MARVERLEVNERMDAERISLKFEMGIRSPDNNRTVDHKDFMATIERLIQEVSAIKNDLKTTIADHAIQSKKLVEETQNAYEWTIMVL